MASRRRSMTLPVQRVFRHAYLIRRSPLGRESTWAAVPPRVSARASALSAHHASSSVCAIHQTRVLRIRLLAYGPLVARASLAILGAARASAHARLEPSCKEVEPSARFLTAESASCASRQPPHPTIPGGSRSRLAVFCSGRARPGHQIIDLAPMFGTSGP